MMKMSLEEIKAMGVAEISAPFWRGRVSVFHLTAKAENISTIAMQTLLA